MVGLGYGFSASTTGIVSVNINFVNVVANGSSTYTTLLRYGIGSAPVNGGALAGTIAATMSLRTPGSGMSSPVGVSAIINIGTSSTATWFDISLAGPSGGSSQATTINGTFIEI